MNAPNSVLGTGEGRLRLAQCPIGFEFYSYATVKALFEDARLRPRDKAYFRWRGASDIVLEFVENGTLSFMADDDHDRVKKVLMLAFTPGAVKKFRSKVIENAEYMLGKVGTGGEIDFVNDFSHFYTLRNIAGYIGMPMEDIEKIDRFTVNFRLLGQVPLEPVLPRLEETLHEVSDYASRLIAERRVNRQDDLLSKMIGAVEDTAKLTEKNLLWATTVLLTAGHDSTRFMFSSCLRVLIEHDLWDALHDDHSLVDAIVGEAMRLYPPTPRQVRIPREPLQIEGHRFDKGDVIVLSMAGAARDPAAISDPDDFVLNRGKVYDLPFGQGRHLCLGHAFARLELYEGLKLLVDRWAKPEIIGPIEFKTTGVICGPEVIPIRFRSRR